MKSCSQLFAMSFLALALESAHGQGTIIPLHSGYNDPATEGFSLSLASASVGAVTNDLGMDAWTTAVPANGLYATYTKKLAPQQTEEMSRTELGLVPYAPSCRDGYDRTKQRYLWRRDTRLLYLLWGCKQRRSIRANRESIVFAQWSRLFV